MSCHYARNYQASMTAIYSTIWINHIQNLAIYTAKSSSQAPDSYGPYTPLYCTPYGFPRAYSSQASHVLSKTPRSKKLSNSSFRSMTCCAKPSVWWNPIWQCSSQTPGLFAAKASTKYPPLSPLAGSVAVSRRGGFFVCRLMFSGVYFPSPLARMRKSWPIIICVCVN